MEYHVTWEIDITADSPRQAAEQAQRHQQTPGSLATVFDITDETGEATRVDLLEDDGPAIGARSVTVDALPKSPSDDDVPDKKLLDPSSDDEKPMALNERETQTVLCALRRLQDPLHGNRQMCEHSDGEPLNNDEIDKLCERLNFFDVAATGPIEAQNTAQIGEPDNGSTEKVVTGIAFDPSERATVLASLRLFQKQYDSCNSDAIRADWPEHFTADDGSTIPPLGSEDIDALCESINCGGK